VTGILNVLVGVMTSVVAWLLVFTFFSPRLRWNGKLTKRDRGESWPGRFRYGMALTNAGWWRSAVAVNVQVRARMPYGRGDAVAANYLIFEIPTDLAFIPHIGVRRKVPWRAGKGSLYVPVLRISAIAEADLSRLPISEDLRTRIRANRVELEELLDLGMQVRFWAWGFDAQTGAIGTASSEWIRRSAQIVVIDRASTQPSPTKSASARLWRGFRRAFSRKRPSEPHGASTRGEAAATWGAE
jgi:hypothetical protein